MVKAVQHEGLQPQDHVMNGFIETGPQRLEIGEICKPRVGKLIEQVRRKLVRTRREEIFAQQVQRFFLFGGRYWLEGQTAAWIADMVAMMIDAADVFGSQVK